ncbi:MAG: P22 phage major capsid protein family protein [Tissierellia bacterium]|nr:P22 phage major capsid protein family protein [Tissierellia bacterium]
MGVENFIPALWSARLFVRLRKALVFGNIVNREYEGELLNFGDQIHINELGPVTASAYTKGATLTYSELDSAQKTLLVDQATEFHFKIDDVNNAQTNPKLMDGAMDEAAYAIADTIDQFIAGLCAQAGATPSVTTYIGSSGSSLSVSSGNVIETFSYASRYLDEANVPKTGRWIVIPPWLTQKLTLAEVGGSGATSVPKVPDDIALRNGFVIRAFGFDIYEYNNVSNDGTQYRVMCGNNSALAYVGQVNTIEALRLQTTFANAARGLYVYGAKAVRPEALLTLYLAEAAG